MALSRFKGTKKSYLGIEYNIAENECTLTQFRVAFNPELSQKVELKGTQMTQTAIELPDCLREGLGFEIAVRQWGFSRNSDGAVKTMTALQVSQMINWIEHVIDAIDRIGD